MAGNKILNVPPAFVPAAAGNLFNTGTSSGAVGFTGTNPYAVMKHIRLTNNDAAAPHTVKLFKGATGASAAGTEFGFAGGVSIAAASYVDWFGQHRFDAADFLTGIADVASKVTINIDAEIGIA